MNLRRSGVLSGLVIGIGLLVLAVVIAANTAHMRVPPSYAKVGPQVFPYLIAAGLGAFGAFIAWRSWRNPDAPTIGIPEARTDWAAVSVIAAALVAQYLLIKQLGFVPMATILFAAVAWAFGSRRYLRDVAVGLVLAVLVYFGFTRGLGLQLPAGLLFGGA